jgi:F0F1-type ATP synthase membrane subunit b/b'
MATQSSKNSSKAKTQAKRATTETKKSAAATAEAGKRAAAKTAVAQKNQVQTVAESAVDFPVGIVLSVGDRVGEIVEPWTGRSSAEKQLKSYRNQLRKTLKRTERRGSTARRKAATEARKTRNRVEREARRRQRTVESTLKSSRTNAERRVRSAIDAPTTRAQDLVSTVSDQLAALR